MHNKSHKDLTRNLPPLAERIRPAKIEDFIGQKILTGDHSLLIRSINRGTPFSFLFWGPPGSGKTTLAKIVAREFQAAFYEMSAVSSGVQKVRQILDEGRINLAENKRTILFIDEIHRFSKSQQDALLHGVEDGSIILIGATTENPSFEVISPLLSRCKVLKLEPYSVEELEIMLDRALNHDILLSQKNIQLTEDIRSLLLTTCGGDARKLLNTLELALTIHQGKEEPLQLTSEDIHEALQTRNVIYDKTGDYHYDTISAFIKSVRGSDPDAAVYWLAVMLEGGEKPEFIARRLLILSSEDIGNADPYALILTNACMQAVHAVGPPESDIILSQVTTYLASTPKSNASYMALREARSFVKQEGAGSVPLQLRNAPTKLMKSMNYGKGYQYPHSFPEHFIRENFFPESLGKSPEFYKPSNQGREKFLKERLASLWKDRYQ